MSTTYLALLRGINVGGNSIIKMSLLREHLEADGFQNVRTYINSGNVIFDSSQKDGDKLAKEISASIKRHFALDVSVAVFTKAEWQQVIANAPDWWGKDTSWKHNILVMLKPYKMEQVLADLGEIKSEIESTMPGKGVLYQSVSLKAFGRTSASKMIGKPVYKQMTIRNFNTANKLAAILG